MLVFVSWSGHRSKVVAGALQGWLEQVIQAVEPWISSDIDKGTRWSPEMADRLEWSMGPLRGWGARKNEGCVTVQHPISPPPTRSQADMIQEILELARALESEGDINALYRKSSPRDGFR